MTQAKIDNQNQSNKHWLVHMNGQFSVQEFVHVFFDDDSHIGFQVNPIFKLKVILKS